MSELTQNDKTTVPTGNAPASEDLGKGGDLGTNGGTGADSGGTGIGATALDAVGSDLKFDSGVADHLKIRHKV